MSRFPLSRLYPDAQGRLPALLALVLALAAVLQMAMTAAVELPPTGYAVAPVKAGPLPAVAPQRADAVILERPLFGPRLAAVDGETAGPAAALGGAVVAGSVRIGRVPYAVVVRPDRTTVRLAVGGRIDGWRLAALGAETARFVRGNERIEVAYGQSASAAGPAEPGE